LKEVFIDQLKEIVFTSEYRAGSGPGFISLKKYTGLLLHGFLFLLTANTREGTRRKEGSKKDLRSVVNRWVSPGGGKKRSRRIGNGKGQMVKTLRKNILTSIVKNVNLFLLQRRFKSLYPEHKRFSLAVPGHRLNYNSRVTNQTMMKKLSSLISLYLFGPVCMPFSPPCKHNSQQSLALILPILSIHLSLESSPLPLTCNQGAKSVDLWQLALRFALLSLPLRRTKSNERINIILNTGKARLIYRIVK
jgi:hypothetical protein